MLFLLLFLLLFYLAIEKGVPSRKEPLLQVVDQHNYNNNNKRISGKHPPTNNKNSDNSTINKDHTNPDHHRIDQHHHMVQMHNHNHHQHLLDEEQAQQYMESFQTKTSMIKKLIENDNYRKRVLRVCNQEEPIPFDAYSSSGSFKRLERFESSTYSEVLKATSSKDNQTVVMKIIRAISKQVIKQVPYMASKGCQSYNDILNEIIITQALSDLHRGVTINDLMYKTQFFCRIYEIKVLNGDMERSVSSSGGTNKKGPDGNNEAGSAGSDDAEEKRKREKRLEEESKLSEEDRMLIEILPREYVVSVMKHDGHPLWWMMNNGKLNEFQMASVLIQVIVGLAIAEKVYKYEHRDLHISNILIKPTSKGTLPYVMDGIHFNIDTFGIKSTIIDATFSRLSRDGRVYYRDLKSTLRSYAGNKPPIKMSLQNRAYRQMVTTTENSWANYTPKTNLIWLTYLCETMLKSEEMKGNKMMLKEIGKLRDYTLKAKNTSDLLAKMPILRSPQTMPPIAAPAAVSPNHLPPTPPAMQIKAPRMTGVQQPLQLQQQQQQQLQQQVEHPPIKKNLA